MRKIMILALIASTVSISNFALAGDCELSVTRIACPGKEAESYKKCDGKPSCTELKETASADGCAKEALKACENSRLDITKSKVITSKFDGTAVESNKDFCAGDRADFNKCS
ncbi:MAG: hypothetical protein SGJ02_13975 [bacterium]|nr:hypothetical protein [bacterium]